MKQRGFARKATERSGAELTAGPSTIVSSIDKAKDAEETLSLIREGVYNLQRPSNDIIVELVAVIELLDARINAVIEGLDHA